MAKEKRREIAVVTVFDGKQDGQEVLIELILKKRRAAADSGRFGIDAAPPGRYTDRKVFSDVRV